MQKLIVFPRRAALVLSILLVSAAVAGTAEPPADPRAGIDGNEQPGQDVEGGPITDGEQFRRLTQITPAEIGAADPEFRRWVDLIRSGSADKRIMRLYWFYRPRLEPFDRPLPARWREEGLAVLTNGGTAAAARSAGAESGGSGIAAAVPTDGTWVPVGPYTVAGRTTGLDRPAGQPDTLYASTADGGVWRTTDRGATWEPLSDFEATLSGGSIVLDPTNPSVIYFGTGEGNGAVDNYPGIGVLKSTDAGVSWTESNEFSSTVRRLAIHASEPTRLYAAGDNGCYVSTDAGTTFDLIDAPGLPTGTSASDVLIRPDNPDWVYCAIWGASGGGIYRSIDRGANWSQLAGGLPGVSDRIALAISQSNPDVLVAGLGRNSGEVWKTTDGGDTWTKPKPGGSLGFCGGQCWYDIAVGIDPADPDLLWAGGISAYKSTDGGVSWAQSSSGVHVDHHFVFTPTAGEVLLANDGGIYHSSNAGANWVEWSIGMDTTQFYGICRDGADDTFTFGGTQDNGSIRRRESDGWQQVLGADGGMCVAGPPGSGILLGEMQNHAVRRSTNQGDSWSYAEDGIGDNEPRPWVGILAVDPTDRNNMWTGTNDVYRSMDAKASAWERVGDSLHCAEIVGCLAVTAIEVAPSDSNTVYVGYRASAPVPPFSAGARGGVFKTTNALDVTVDWTDRTGPAFPYRSVSSLAVHPDNADVVYAVFSGAGAEKIWKSSDGGATWADHTGDFPPLHVSDLIVDPDGPGTLLAATDLGVYRSDDDGATWYGFSDGLPRSAAIQLTYNRSTGTLRVGTHGRSVFEWQAAAAGTPVAVPDGTTGTPMTATRLDASTMRVSWDVSTCTSAGYNLFHGDLDDVATLTYTGSECGLGTAGQADVPMPATASGNAFFVVVAEDGAGTEGPHGLDSSGQPRAADGFGSCGITSQDPLATCP